MSTRFPDILRRVEVRLAVPQPARSRILHEMAADLDDLYAAYRARGLTEEEALQRAEAALGASPEAVDALVQLHRPVWARLLTRFSIVDEHRLERVLVTLLPLTAIAAAVSRLSDHWMTHAPSPFVWPALGTIAAALIVATSVFFRLVVRQDHRTASLRAGLLPMLALAVMLLMLCVWGVAWELNALMSTVARSGGAQYMLVMPYLRRGAEVLAIGLTGNLAILLAWFHLRARAQDIALTEALLPVAHLDPPHMEV